MVNLEFSFGFKNALPYVSAKGSRGRKPFSPNEETAVLVFLRRKEVWPCFAENCLTRVGSQGFLGLGYYEQQKERGESTHQLLINQEDVYISKGQSSYGIFTQFAKPHKNVEFAFWHITICLHGFISRVDAAFLAKNVMKHG